MCILCQLFQCIIGLFYDALKENDCSVGFIATLYSKYIHEGLKSYLLSVQNPDFKEASGGGLVLNAKTRMSSDLAAQIKIHKC